MGIFKAATGAAGGVMADQWLEFFYCNSLPNDVLAMKGQKRTGENSANTKGEKDVISDGSIIAVNDGQCAIVIELGKIIGVFKDPGEHVFHSKHTKSIFSGGGLSGIGSQIGERFGFGGDVAIHQFVMYIDTKEQLNYPFSGTFQTRMTDKNTGLDYLATVHIGGIFSFRITDPELFYKRICGNATGTVLKKDIEPQLSAEVISAMAVAAANVCEEGINPAELPAHTEQFCRILKSSMTEKWSSLRGFTVISSAISSLSIAEEDLRAFQNAQRAKMLTDPRMAAATLVDAQAQAMTTAAQNGGGTGLFGVAAVNALSGNAAPAADTQAKPENIFLQSSPPKLWRCKCGNMNTTNFCENCGAKRPE